MRQTPSTSFSGLHLVRGTLQEDVLDAHLFNQ
jgi:hypothetical protein